MFELGKLAISRTFLREGAVRTIIRGPARGLRYRIFRQYGLGPLFGRWEPIAQQLMVKRLKPGDVAYDIGANYGIHALLLARLVGNTGHLYAFEPVPLIMGALQENVALNGFSNTTFIPLAMSDGAGTASFFTGHHDGAGHLATVGDQQGQSIIVETGTLDDFVFLEKNRPPNFIKMDIEGAETRAIAGAERTLATYHPILLIDLHGLSQYVSVRQMLAKHGYQISRTEDGMNISDLSNDCVAPQGIWSQIIASPR
jgi:FkbM family methyltransferase